MGIGGISIWQILIVLILILLLFGGTKRIKSLGSDLAKTIKSFRKTMDEEDKDNNYLMFDIGFFELLLVLLVGLVVLGPKRLPEAIKSISKSLLWIKKQANRSKQEMGKAFGLNEIYQDSRNEEILKDLEDSNK